MKKERDLAA